MFAREADSPRMSNTVPNPATDMLSAAAQSRVDQIGAVFQVLNGGKPVTRVFVANRLDDNGQLVYSDLWGFTDVFLLASRNFMTEDNADISPYRNSISYIGLEYSGAVFGEAAPEDDWGMSVELETGGHTYSQFSAVGRNCFELARIVRELFVPNLRSDMLHLGSPRGP